MSRKSKERNVSGEKSTNRWLGITLAAISIVLVIVVFMMTRPKETEETADLFKGPTPELPVASQPSEHDHTAEQTVERITPSDLKAALERGEAVVVDVRSFDAFSQEHIPGSLHIPLSLVESQVARLPATQKIVTYCT